VIMNQATWILLLVSVIYFAVALFVVKKPIARRNYLFTASIFLIIGIGMAVINYFRGVN